MFIKELNLQNIGMINDASLQFSKGLNVILGANGHGKSTVLTSIAYMLTGYARDGQEGILQWGKKKGNMSMSWEHLGDEFEQSVGFNPAVSRELIINHQDPPFDTLSEVKGKLKELYDPKLAQLSMFYFENEDDLIRMSPAKRREYLKSVYDLKFSKQSAAVLEELKPLEEGMNNTKAKIDQAELAEFKPNEPLPLSLSDEEFIVLQTQVETYVNIIRDLDTQITQLSQNALAIKAANGALGSCQDSITRTTSSKSIAETESTKVFDYSVHENTIDIARVKLETETFGRIPLWDESELTDARKILQFANNIYVAELTQYNNVKSGKCPTCGAEYTVDNIADYASRVADAKVLMDNAQVSVNTLVTEKKAHDALVLVNNATKGRVDLLTLQIANAEKTLVTKKQTDIDTQLLYSKQVDEYATQLIKLQEDLQVKQLAYGNAIKLPTDGQTILLQKTTANNALNECNVSINAYNDIVTKNKATTLFNEEQVRLSKVNDERIALLKAEVTANEVRLVELQREKVIWDKEFPNFMITYLSTFIQSTMNQFLDDTYDGRYHVKLEADEAKDSLNILYGNYDKDVKNASGYESALFSISYKDSFNRIKGFNFICLDEVDKQADTNNSKLFFEVIAGLKTYEQMIVITHKTETKEFLINELGAKCFLVKDNTIEEFEI